MKVPVNSVTTFNTAKAYIGVAIFSALTFAERSGVRSKRDERKLSSTPKERWRNGIENRDYCQHCRRHTRTPRYGGDSFCIMLAYLFHDAGTAEDHAGGDEHIMHMIGMYPKQNRLQHVFVQKIHGAHTY